MVTVLYMIQKKLQKTNSLKNKICFTYIVFNMKSIAIFKMKKFQSYSKKINN